ncbi:hypothetical protein [Allobranchiibius sp. GilTou73]|uniref:hypothetical protein n=1 Tax=Allobranchiibius sp. GilTou73 TaxID=2904523 RepID=UPI001F292011|nr:hypothetical protein [Allobranchiibius sp. GilTou73]UIJ36411.1 hypothetical protein LVQ62_08650 [Allobranchiibius sp. GilTou73]
MTLSLLGALAAAIAYGAATILQAIGVRRLSALPSDPGWRARVPGASMYFWGLLLDGLGFVFSAAALRTLPLFLVESAVASSVAFTAVLAVLFLGVRLRGREIGALVGVVLGLALLAVSAHEGPAKHVGHLAGWLLLAAAAVVAAVIATGWWAVRDAGSSALTLAAAAGAGFGMVGVAARILFIPHDWWRLLGEVTFWALVAHGVLATVCYGLALDRGRTTTVAAVTFAVETVLPAAIGLAFLGDDVRRHLAIVAVLGFAVTLGSCVALASRAEPDPG